MFQSALTHSTALTLNNGTMYWASAYTHNCHLGFTEVYASITHVSNKYNNANETISNYA